MENAIKGIISDKKDEDEGGDKKEEDKGALGGLLSLGKDNEESGGGEWFYFSSCEPESCQLCVCVCVCALCWGQTGVLFFLMASLKTQGLLRHQGGGVSS